MELCSMLGGSLDGGKFGEWGCVCVCVCVFVCLCCSAVHLKLSQLCWLTILQYNIFKS